MAISDPKQPISENPMSSASMKMMLGLLPAALDVACGANAVAVEVDMEEAAKPAPIFIKSRRFAICHVSPGATCLENVKHFIIVVNFRNQN